MNKNTLDLSVQNISSDRKRNNQADKDQGDNVYSTPILDNTKQTRPHIAPEEPVIPNVQTKKSYLDEFIEDINTIVYIKQALGEYGKAIRVYKLRTMIKDADFYLPDILKKHDENNLNHQGKLVNDPRVTKTGKFLRKFWIDEAPQFYNILKGDMKLVGVRPMQEEFWHKYPSDIKEKALKQKPGLMGVNYATSQKDGAAHFEVLRQYLHEYEKRPFTTDVKYFLKIWHNIIVKGERSR